MPFEKGQCGNPNGRPPGARNKATIMAEMLLQGEAETMTRLVIERAKAGDMAAIRINSALERFLSQDKDEATRLGNSFRRLDAILKGEVA